MADACRTDIELQQARSRLIQGREEERRRLRHDLHDGLGPILTGAAFSADAASNLVEIDPAGASELIASTRHDVTAALDEIRRIVDDLRPPALDELGLVGAIGQHAQRLPQLDGDGKGPWLPGVGLVSMRDRASELGGDLVAGTDGSGGHVVASLPVETP